MPTRTLTMPELMVIASVLTGKLDEYWTTHPAFYANVSVDVAGSPEIDLKLSQLSATPADNSTWLEQLADALGTTVSPPSIYGLATVHVRDWEGTGIHVHACERVCEPEKLPQETS